MEATGATPHSARSACRITSPTTQKPALQAPSSPICGQSDTIGSSDNDSRSQWWRARCRIALGAAPSPPMWEGTTNRLHSYMRHCMRILLATLALAFPVLCAAATSTPEQVAAQLLESYRTSNYQGCQLTPPFRRISSRIRPAMRIASPCTVAAGPREGTNKFHSSSNCVCQVAALILIGALLSCTCRRLSTPP